MGSFAIVHVGSGKHLAEYASEPSALCAVSDVVRTRGQAAVSHLRLEYDDAAGHTKTLATGPELAKRAALPKRG
jgi:hypothetical protein